MHTGNEINSVRKLMMRIHLSSFHPDHLLWLFLGQSFKKLYTFIYFIFWQWWVFVAVCGLSLVAASGAFSLFWCKNISLWVASPPAEHRLWSTGSAVVG